VGEKKWILRILKKATDWGSTKEVVKFIHSVQKKHMSLDHVDNTSKQLIGDMYILFGRYLANPKT